MRFYNQDGIEDDVQEEKYHFDENEYIEINESIQELLNNYA